MISPVPSMELFADPTHCDPLTSLSCLHHCASQLVERRHALKVRTCIYIHVGKTKSEYTIFLLLNSYCLTPSPPHPLHSSHSLTSSPSHPLHTPSPSFPLHSPSPSCPFHTLLLFTLSLTSSPSSHFLTSSHSLNLNYPQC